MTHNQKQELLNTALLDHQEGISDMPVISDLSELPKNYRGHALHINDHGNVSLYNCFKNGNVREVASRV